MNPDRQLWMSTLTSVLLLAGLLLTVLEMA